jgi:hypothetical protein
VDRDDATAKLWLLPVALARSIGFGAKELRTVEQLIVDHETELLEAWHEYFGA